MRLFATLNLCYLLSFLLVELIANFKVSIFTQVKDVTKMLTASIKMLKAFPMLIKESH
jgi:hypothetical protein